MIDWHFVIPAVLIGMAIGQLMEKGARSLRERLEAKRRVEGLDAVTRDREHGDRQATLRQNQDGEHG